MNSQNESGTPKRPLYKYMPFSRRPGSTDENKYELYLTTLLALRILLYGDENSWLATNADGVGDFDDVIVNFKKVTYLLQLKHSVRDKKAARKKKGVKKRVVRKAELMATEGNVSMSMYKHADSITKLVESLSDGTTEAVTRYLSSEIVLAIYTNMSCPDHGVLEMDKDSDFSLFNTNKSKATYKIKTDQFEGIKNQEYCKHIRLLADQASKHDIKILIHNQIENIVNKFDLPDINVKTTVATFSSYIDDWAQGLLGGNYCLTRGHILSFIAQFSLSPYSCLNTSQTFPQLPKEWAQPLVDWDELVRDRYITIVNAQDDDYVVPFLEQYILDKTQQYCTSSKSDWKASFTEESANQFYRNNEELKQSMLHIIGSKGKLSYCSIYECLWSEGQIPLLLSVDSKQLNLFKFLSCYGCELKFILICKSPEPLKVTRCFKNVFVSLEDLHERSREIVLNKRVQLQGRVTQQLNQFLSESMFNLVTVKDIIEIISNKFNIGNHSYSVPKYYLEPRLQRLLFSIDVLADKNHYFVLENPKEVPVNISGCSLNEFSKDTKHNVIILSGTEPLDEIRNKMNDITKPIHHFRIFTSQTLEWIESTGSVETIRNYRDVSDRSWIKLEEKLNDQNTYFVKYVPVVIDANPGMGKSTIMNYIATKASNPVWILKIDLNRHTNYFEETLMYLCSECDSFQYKSILWHFCADSLKHCMDPSNKQLFLRVFDRFVESKKILLLADGFDEISVQFKEVVTEMLHTIKREGYSVWVTTRPVMQQHLENALLSFSTTLKPFTQQNQIKFLERFYRCKCELPLPLPLGSNQLLEEFITKLLEVARTQLNGISNDSDFAAVPLQLELLADVFQEDCKKYIDSKETELNNAIDLLDLYTQFFDKKFNVYYDKVFKEDNSAVRYNAKKIYTMYKEHQQLIALQLLFNSRYLRELDIDKRLAKYYEKYDEAQQLQEGGIVIAYQKFNEQTFSFVFIHRTFAEFMAAQWLLENYVERSSPVREVVRHLLDLRYFEKHHQFLFKILDLMLCKGKQAHKLIINEHFSDVSQLLRDKPEKIKETDAGGRSVLHLMALYDSIHASVPRGQYLYQTKQPNIPSVSSALDLQSEIIQELTSDALGHDVVYYAIRNFALSIANKLCEVLPTYEVNFRVPPADRLEYFQRCCELDYKALFRKLLKHFALRDLLNKDVKPDEAVKSYCQIDYLLMATSTFVEEIGVRSLSEFVSVKQANDEDLHLAVVFGTEENINALIASGAAVNEEDVYDNTPLHYAVRHERLDVVKTLVNKGAQINKAGDGGSVALHLAAEEGDTNTIEYLLHNGARINQTDEDNNTPLLLALFRRKTAAASLLIAKGADPNINNARGKSPICAAAFIGANRIISQLVDKGADVNAEDGHRNIPLHYAVFNNYNGTVELILNNRSKVDCYMKAVSARSSYSRYDTPTSSTTALILAATSNNAGMVELLLRHNADCNLKDSNKETALHHAVQYGHRDIVRALLTGNADINIQNHNQQTPLHISVNFARKSITNLLLAKNPDLSIRDIVGKMPLHLAVIRNCVDVVASLIEKGANIDARDQTGFTPLHFALYCGNWNIARLLLQHNANAHALSNRGERPIDFASRIGNPDLLKEIVEKEAD